MKHRAYINISMLALLVTACQSTPEGISPDLPPQEYFKYAQEAVVERSDYDAALVYYQAFLERFPDDIQRSVEAEYEVAFIYYKQNDLVNSERLFTNLLSKYQGDGAELLPQWPRILSEKLVDKIRNTPAG